MLTELLVLVCSTQLSSVVLKALDSSAGRSLSDASNRILGKPLDKVRYSTPASRTCTLLSRCYRQPDHTYAYSRHSLARLFTRMCADYCTPPPHQRMQMSDWDARPLSQEQTQYAALDAFCLVQIVDKLYVFRVCAYVCACVWCVGCPCRCVRCTLVCV